MSKKHLLTLALFIITLVIVGCHAVEPPPFNPAAIQRMQRERATQHPIVEYAPLPTTIASPFPPPAGARGAAGAASRPTWTPATQPMSAAQVRMTLHEIIHRTVANNYEVRVAGYEAAIDEKRVVELEGKFDPSFFANGQFQKDYTTNFTTDPTAPRSQRTWQFETGIKQDTPSGAHIELKYQTQRQDLRPPFFTINPFWQNQFTFQVTQPLLQNFGVEVNRARITVARNDQKISLLDFRDKLEKNVADVEKSYWQLFQAIREVQIQEELLAKTRETGRIVQQRYGGDVSNLQLSQSNTTIMERETPLHRAYARVRDLSDQIKALMNDPDLPVSSASVIMPADMPVEIPIRYEVADQIDTALQNRIELIQQQLRIDSASTIVTAAKNNLLPQLNLVGQIGLSGFGEDFSGASRQQTDFDFITYTIGLQFEVPIGNRAPRAIWERTLLQRQEAIEQYRGLVQKVEFDVMQAWREVGTSWAELGTARQFRLNAQERVSSLEERKDQLSAEFLNLKLDAQQQLANAQRSEIAALVGYNIAVSALERASGIL